MGRKRKRALAYEQEDEPAKQISNYDLIKPAQEGVHLYTEKSELPWDLQPYAVTCLSNSSHFARLTCCRRYWKQRHSIFSLYDSGIWTTDDSWFEVTQECVAK